MMPPKRGAPPRLGPTTDECDFAADLLQIASSLTLDAISDCNFAAREDHLAPRAGRGRKARAARHPGEGQTGAAEMWCGRGPAPHPGPLPAGRAREGSFTWAAVRPTFRGPARRGA